METANLDPALVALDETLARAVDFARAALLEDAAPDRVGEHIGVVAEASGYGHAVTHQFVASLPGYVGWYWAVSIARGPEDDDAPTVNETVLLPGEGSIKLAPWVPWSQRLTADDLHPGDVVPSNPTDERLAPGYTLSDDPQVESVAWELGLGRERVLSRYGRLDAAARWRSGSHGANSAMARHAPAHCGTCGFYLPLAGSLQGLFGACANEISPADANVVSAEYGCGAHSDATESMNVELATRGELIYNTLDVDLTKLRRGSGILNPQRRERAHLVRAAVITHAQTRRATNGTAATSPQQVMSAIRGLFAQRIATVAAVATEANGEQAKAVHKLSRTKR